MWILWHDKMDVIARIAAYAFDRFAQLAADQFGGSRLRIGFMGSLGEA